MKQQQESEEDLDKADPSPNAENAALNILNTIMCLSFLLCGRMIRIPPPPGCKFWIYISYNWVL